MDLFDDNLLGAPASRLRLGAKFAPKSKSKQFLRKEIPASEHATSSEDRKDMNVASTPTFKQHSEKISQNECHNVVIADSIGFEVRSVTKSIPETDLNNESELNNVASPSTTCSTIGRVKEPPNNGECSFLDGNKTLEVNNSLQAGPIVDVKSASGNSSAAVSENNIQSIFNSGKVQQVFSAEFELDPFSSGLLDLDSVNAHKVPKIKPRPGVDNASTIAPASSSIMMEKSIEFPTCTNEVQYLQSSGDGFGGLNNSTCLPLPTSEILRSTNLSDMFDYMSSSTPFSEDNRNMAGVIPSQSDFVNAVPSAAVVCSGTTGFCKSTAETADIFSVPKTVDDFLTQRTTEELTNSVDSPTLADSLQQDVTREKEDANEKKKSLRKCKRSSFAGVEDGGGKSTRQLRKQKTCEPVKNSNSLIEDDDELDPPYVYNNDEEEEDEVDYSSKKKRALKSSKQKYVAKKGKTYKKRKEISDSEKTTKEPPKKFSHSSRRRKRCVDQTLLDDYECDSRSMPLRDIIAVANYKEQLEKKEPKSSNNQSGEDFFHDAGANYEEETFGSDDDIRDQYDDQASEKFTSTIPLYNYQSFMDKPLRVKWSKQDTEKFYEALREFGPDFGLIQQIFPGKTRRQIKLKYKNEDRHHPLQITDAIHSHSTDHSLFKSVIAKLPRMSTTDANQEAIEDSEDMSPGINEEVATSKQDHADIEDQDDIMTYNSPEQSHDCDDDLLKWSQYQSSI